VEIASDELITEADNELIHRAFEQLCAQYCSEFADNESKITARAIFHDAVVAASKTVADGIAEEFLPIAREIVAGMLKSCSQHAYVEGLVIEASLPIVRNGAYSAIQRCSEDEAIPKAEEAARKVIYEFLHKFCVNSLQTPVLIGLKAVLQINLDAHTALADEEKEKLVKEYLSGDTTKKVKELIGKGYNSGLRRLAQRAAEMSVEEIAAQATDDMARSEALEAARVASVDTARLEISRLVMAEVQRRAARLARERLQVEAANQEEEKRAEYCQEEAKRIAEEAVNSVTAEIADPSVTDLDLEKAKELALSASSAVAREFSGAYQLPSETEGSYVSPKTLVLLAVQIFIGCFIVWFFLLGGYEICEPLLKSILPTPVYQSIYRSVPHREPTPGAKNNVEVEDLLDEQKIPSGEIKENPESEVPAVKPAAPAAEPEAPAVKSPDSEPVPPDAGKK
jgi:hypothetical protein